jgi:hypothetical protein
MKVTHLLVANFIAFQGLAFGAETDAFTKRDEPLEDVTAILNEKANNSIKEALKSINSEANGCVEKDLYKELRKHFANHMSGIFIIDILEDKDLPKRQVDLEDSVYADWKAWDGIGLGFVLKYKSDVVMSPILNVSGHFIGTDKFEHMFGQGFHYFTDAYLKGKGPDAAVKSGAFREKFMLGGNRIGNGVFSFGDLSANFNGMRFWNHMLQKRPDVLGAEHNVGPYIACEKNRWVQVKDLDFSYYADSSLDESINCSKFPGPKTLAKFNRRVKATGQVCPVNRTELQEMIVKYKHMAKWMINPKGNMEFKFIGKLEDSL